MASTALSIDLPYVARFRFLGRADWVCPHCGRVNSSRFVVGQAYVLCKDKDCGKRYGIGVTLYTLRQDGPRVRMLPSDYIIPRDAVPIASVGVEPTDGAPWHRVADAPSDDSDASTVTP